MANPDNERSLIPTIQKLIEIKQPSNVTDFLEAFHSPVAKIGRSLHTEFSGINLRGVITHNVEVLYDRPEGYYYANGSMSSIDMQRDQITIITDLKRDELLGKGQVLNLFLNELELVSDEVEKGFIMLENTQEKIPESKCPFTVGVMLTEDALKKGKSGFRVSSSGKITVFPNIASERTEKYRSGLENKNYKLFSELSNISKGEIKHPLVERLIVETAFLVGKAIVSRKAKSEFS